MPLLHDGSDESRDKNIATLRNEGKEEKQAVAIAYSIQRRARGEAEPEEVAKGILTMTSGEFAEEHKRLIRVLRSPGHADDAEEAKRQEAEVREEAPEDAGEIIGKADQGPAEEENQAIRRSMKTPQAHGRHEFSRAKWTAGNGHPRCLICGDEEPQGGICMGIHGAVPVNSDTLAKADRGPHRMLTEHEVRQRAHEKEPTEAQLHAGNYPKTHWNMHGMRIAIENLAGSKRRGVDHKGEPWEVTMPYHYGYIKGTEGADGDHLDVAVGPLMGQGTEAHIINQRGPGGEFDEHKVFIGYPSREAAIHAFRAGRSDNPDDVMGAVVTVPIEELKRWIDEGCLKEEAILKAEQAHVKAHYRNMNGKIVYVHDYDITVHGAHPQATLRQRTVLGEHSSGTHTLRATDAEDREAIKSKAAEMGAKISHIKRSGANHHGRKGAYDVIHFWDKDQAKAVHDALGQEGEKPKTDAPGPDTGDVAPGPDKGPGSEPPPDPVEDANLTADGYVAATEGDHDWDGNASELATLHDNLAVVNTAIKGVEHKDLRVELGAKMRKAFGARFLKQQMPLTDAFLIKTGDKALRDAVQRVLGGASTPDEMVTAKTIVYSLKKGLEQTEKPVELMANDPYGVGAVKGNAQALALANSTVLDLIGTGNESAGAFGAWGDAVKKVSTYTAELTKTVGTKASDLIGFGNDIVASDKKTFGHETPEGKQTAIKGLQMLELMQHGAGDTDQSIKKMIYELQSELEIVKKVHAYNQTNGAQVMEAAKGMAKAGDKEGARAQFMLAAMAFHHAAQSAKNLGKTEAGATLLEKANEAANEAHALAA